MSKPRHYTASELIREALHCAIRDRDSYAACGDGDASERAAELAEAFRGMLAHRYGEIPDADRRDGKAVSIFPRSRDQA